MGKRYVTRKRGCGTRRGTLCMPRVRRDAAEEMPPAVAGQGRPRAPFSLLGYSEGGVRERGENGSVVEEILVRQKREADEGVLAGVRDWARSLFVALVLFLLIRSFGVEAFKIPTASMEGTLLVGDFLLVNKAVYGAHVPGTDLKLPAFFEPERGDVIVFNPPHEPARNYVKRLVGLPLDTLEMRDKHLYLNGSPLYEPYAKHLDQRGDAEHPDMRWQSNHLVAAPPREYQPTRDNWGPIIVPRDRYFVLGDNRDNSEASRYWGFVHRDPRGAERAPWLRGVRWRRIGAAVR